MSEILNKPEVAKIYIDARGPRFGAAITTTVLAIALVTQSTWLLAAQGLVFLIGAVRGPQFTPFLNAAFNYCLGCEMYLLGLRFTSK